MKAGQLISMLKGLEDFELKDCGITHEILNDLRPHGYWDGSECSVCHDDLSNYQYDMPNIVYPCCPFCGAEMDLKKKK